MKVESPTGYKGDEGGDYGHFVYGTFTSPRTLDKNNGKTGMPGANKENLLIGTNYSVGHSPSGGTSANGVSTTFFEMDDAKALHKNNEYNHSLCEVYKNEIENLGCGGDTNEVKKFIRAMRLFNKWSKNPAE
jgi:hypothetical protein